MFLLTAERIKIIVIFLVGIFLGAYIYHFFAPEPTPTVNENSPTVTDTTKIDTTTQVSYVPKEVVTHVVKNDSGQEYTVTDREKTDVDVKIGKPTLNVSVNGNQVEFQKLDSEQFIFQNGKAVLQQETKVTTEIKIPTLDNTKYWGAAYLIDPNDLGNKIYQVEFPVNKKHNLGGIIQKESKENRTALGLIYRF